MLNTKIYTNQTNNTKIVVANVSSRLCTRAVVDKVSYSVLVRTVVANITKLAV